MEIVLQLALIILPAGAVLITAVLFMRKESERESKDLKIALKKERHKFFLPNRVDAYQRVVLLLERIHPNSLIMRHNNPGLPYKALQIKFLEAIREEYEHNIAQQLFISPEAWNLVKKSKEETVKIINLAGSQMGPAATGMDLMSKIFEIVGEVGTLPSEVAVEALKKELQQLF